MSGIACPRCSRTDRWQVIDSRPSAGTVRRRRRCTCGLRITTHEVHVEQLEDLHNMHGSIVQLHRLASEALKSATLFHEVAKQAFRGAPPPHGEPEESGVALGDRLAAGDTGEASPRRSDDDEERRVFTMGRRYGPLSAGKKQ